MSIARGRDWNINPRGDGLIYMQDASGPAPSFVGMGTIGNTALNATKDGPASGLTVKTVTNLLNSGVGSFREAIDSGQTSGILIQFAVEGTITLTADLSISNESQIYIDGASAPGAGITLEQGDEGVDVVNFEGVTDLVLVELRALGAWSILTAPHPAGEGASAADMFGIISCERVVFDHVTSAQSSDGDADISWKTEADLNTISNDYVTMSNCFFYHTEKTQLIKYGPQNNITLFRNLYAENTERQPLIWHEVFIDCENNVIFNWRTPVNYQQTGSNKGMELTEDSDPESSRGGNGQISGNFVNNVFLEGPDTTNLDDGLVIQYRDGPGGFAGQIWSAGNLLAPDEDDVFPVTAPGLVAVPAGGAVAAIPASSLVVDMIDDVGKSTRNAVEDVIIAKLRTRAGI